MTVFTDALIINLKYNLEVNFANLHSLCSLISAVYVAHTVDNGSIYWVGVVA